MSDLGNLRTRFEDAINLPPAMLPRRSDVMAYATALEAEVERLTAALTEEQAESLRQAEIARDALARIPDPDDLREVLLCANDYVRGWAEQGADTSSELAAIARLRATLEVKDE